MRPNWIESSFMNGQLSILIYFDMSLFSSVSQTIFFLYISIDRISFVSLCLTHTETHLNAHIHIGRGRRKSNSLIDTVSKRTLNEDHGYVSIFCCLFYSHIFHCDCLQQQRKETKSLIKHVSLTLSH